jgi:hypothetical protein
MSVKLVEVQSAPQIDFKSLRLLIYGAQHLETIIVLIKKINHADSEI